LPREDNTIEKVHYWRFERFASTEELALALQKKW
jgi:hypothetical protein